MEDENKQAPVAGSGPLYEHGEAGKQAAEQPVNIPGSEKKKEEGVPTGERQAAENRELDPPA